MVYRRCIERVNGFTNQQTLVTWGHHLVGKKTIGQRKKQWKHAPLLKSLKTNTPWHECGYNRHKKRGSYGFDGHESAKKSHMRTCGIGDFWMLTCMILYHLD